MAVLNNPRQELFAQKLVEGMSQIDASLAYALGAAGVTGELKRGRPVGRILTLRNASDDFVFVCSKTAGLKLPRSRFA